MPPLPFILNTLNATFTLPQKALNPYPTTPCPTLIPRPSALDPRPLNLAPCISHLFTPHSTSTPET